MTIKELLATEAGAKGISVDGYLKAIWPPKKGPYGPTQFMLITDGTDIVAVQAKGTSFPEEEKGKSIHIEGASWRSYESGGATKFVLDVTKNKSSVISLSGEAAPVSVRPQKVVENIEEVKEEILKEYKESLIKSMELLGDNVVSEMLAVCKEKGWETKDVTSVAAALYIELNKKKHIADMRR